MELKMPQPVQKYGRAYSLVVLPAMMLSAGLAVIGMWKNPTDMLFYMDWWFGVLQWVLGFVAVKELPKIAGVIKNGITKKGTE